MTREDDPGAGAPPWLTTMVDLVSLLLAFMVLLFGLSGPASHSNSEPTGAAALDRAAATAHHDAASDSGPPLRSEAGDARYLSAVLAATVGRDQAEASVLPNADGSSLVISIAGEALFDGDGTTQNRSGAARLSALAAQLARLNHPVVVRAIAAEADAEAFARAMAVGRAVAEAGLGPRASAFAPYPEAAPPPIRPAGDAAAIVVLIR